MSISRAGLRELVRGGIRLGQHNSNADISDDTIDGLLRNYVVEPKSTADQLCDRLLDATKACSGGDHAHLIVRSSGAGIQVQLNNYKSDDHDTLTEALDDVQRQYVASVEAAISRSHEHVAINKSLLARLGVGSGEF